MAKHLTKNDLDKFTSKIWYSNFDHGEGGCEKDSFYSEIKDELEGTHYRYYELSKISDNIVRALCYIYKRKIYHQNYFDKDRCSYLYYWLGEKIYSIVHHKTVFSRIINMIYQVLSQTNMFTTCIALHENIDKDTFIKYKLLFDYSKDRENINLDTLNPNTTCDENYKGAIDKYINTYKDVYSSCNNSDENKYDCQKIFSLFGNENYSDLISFSCKKIQTHTLSTLEEGKSSHRGNEVPEFSDSKRNHNPGFYQDIDKNLQPEIPPASYLNYGSGTQHEIDNTLFPPMDDTAEGGSTKTIMGSVVPVLGVSSISLVLYKVTPVGGFINKLLGRNINMYNPMEDMNAFNPYSAEMDPGSRTMNISYHRL